MSEYARIMPLFKKWDRNEDGVISRDELSGLLTSLNPELDEAGINELFDACDPDGNGELDIAEFVEHLCKESTEDWVEVNETSSTEIDKALWTYYRNPRTVPYRLKIEDLVKGRGGSVDFRYLTTYYKAGRRGRVLPLRRSNAETRAQTHPSTGPGQHPWYKKRVALKDAETKDWLTNDFFFRAFSQAVKDGGGEVDFTPEELFDFRWNDDDRGKAPEEAELSRRGGVLYREAAGWKKFAIKCKGTYDDGDAKWMRMSGGDGEWAVAYHGTAMKIVPLIIKNGFLVGSGQGARNSEDVRTGETCGKGVYCTPNLTTVECYANGNEDGGSEQKEAAATIDGHTLYFALQCRVRPGAIRRPIRNFAKHNDEEVMGIDGTFEWVINDPADIRPYGILVRSKEGADHRTLATLINGDAWNKEHKPLPRGSFDHIPGCSATPEELDHSYELARKNLG